MLIYLVTNKLDGKQYVGQTVNSLAKRKCSHLSNARLYRDNLYFHSAIRKYGPDNFKWKIIHNNINIIDELNRLEIFYIGYYNTFGKENGYNLTLGGDGTMGYKHSDETKQKMSIATSGKNHPLYGRCHSKESKLKMSIANSGKNHPHYGKRGKDSHMYGKKASIETRKKMSLSKIGKNCYWYGKRGKDSPNYGKKASAETKLKMSEANKGKYTGKDSAVAKAVIINDMYFDTLNEASEFVGIGSSGVRLRILHKTKWTSYHYATGDE